MRWKLLVSLLCFLHSLPGQSQRTDFIFHHYNRSNGLPVDVVNCLAQDKLSFVWIGSKEGLFRFDGFTYKAYHNQPSVPLSLPNNYVSVIHVDSKGLLWVGTMGGLALMQSDGTVLDVLNSETNMSFTKFSDNISDIREMNGKVWVSTGEGLFCLQEQQKKFTKPQKYDLKKSFSFPTNVLGQIQPDRQGRLWIGTMKGLVIFHPQQNTLRHKNDNPEQLPFLREDYAVKSFFLDTTTQQLWYANWQPSLKVYDFKTKQHTTLFAGLPGRPQYEKLANCFLKDKQHRLWIATGEGLKYAGADASVTGIIESRNDNPYGLQDPVITHLLRDRDGLLWVGTLNGISVTHSYRQEVTNIATHNSHQYLFGKHQVSAVVQVDDSTLLVGTYNGNGLFETDNHFSVRKHHRFGNFQQDWIWHFHRHKNKVYIAAQGATLLYQVNTKTLTKLREPPFDRFAPITSFVAAGDTAIWMSRYYNEFLRYHPATKQYKKFSLSSLGEEPGILHLAQDTDSTLWLIADNQGLLRFHTTKEKITERILPGKNGLLQSQIMFVRDADDYFLIGYVSKGISLYHKKQKTFAHYSHADGLVSNSVSDAYVKDHIAWITTTNGISRFDLKTKTFTTYNQNKGILENDFQSITSLPDGRLVAGSTKGLIYFHPLSPQTKPQLHAPILTEVVVQGKTIAEGAWKKAKTLSIPYDQNDFSFEFISLDYTNQRRIEYAYKLEGHDRDWVMAGNRRFVSYSNIRGGDYRFLVKARLPGGEWVESSNPISLFVGTPFYRQWWFYVLCGLALFAAGYALFRYRVNQLLRFEKMRSDISSDLHDEVGATLSSISLFSEMARQAEPANAKTEQYLKRIGERSRESIEKMSDIVWSIHPENDSLQQLLTRMKNYVNELFEDRDTEVHWKEEHLDDVKLDMQQRKNLYLLFKEAISNAAKYAAAKNIHVTLLATHHLLYLEVRDDGRGCDLQNGRAGNGIRNMKQRAGYLNAKIDIVSAIGEGTAVRVSVPR